MAKTYKEIKAALPNLESEKVRDISDELDRILRIKMLVQSEGGIELVKSIRSNCAVALRKSIISAKNGDEELLIANVLEYSANVDLLSTLQDISIEEELRQQLDDAVIEASR